MYEWRGWKTRTDRFELLLLSVTWPLTCAFRIPCMHTPEIIYKHRGVCDNMFSQHIFVLIRNCSSLLFESNRLFIDEQNVFHANQCCSDHIFDMFSVIKNSILDKSIVFANFADMREKAFEWNGRDLFIYKIIAQFGITEILWKVTQSTYSISNPVLNWLTIKQTSYLRPPQLTKAIICPQFYWVCLLTNYLAIGIKTWDLVLM